jgi:hypothetical protein
MKSLYTYFKGKDECGLDEHIKAGEAKCMQWPLDEGPTECLPSGCCVIARQVEQLRKVACRACCIVQSGNMEHVRYGGHAAASVGYLGMK